MAVSFVAQSTLVYGTSALTVDKPTGTAENDIIVLIHCHDDASDHVTAHWPSEFTEGAGSPYTACGDHGFSWAWKIAGDSEPANYTFSDSHGGEQQGAIAITLRGIDTVDPIDDEQYTCDSATAVIESPSVIVSSDGSFVICASGTGTYSHTRGFQDDAQFPDISGALSNAFYSGYDDTYFSLIGASGAFDSGATGTLDFGCDTGASENVSAITIAFNPAAGGTTHELDSDISSRTNVSDNLISVYGLNSNINSKVNTLSDLNFVYDLNLITNSKSLISSSLGSAFNLNSNTYSKASMNTNISLINNLISLIDSKALIISDLEAFKNLVSSINSKTQYSFDLNGIYGLNSYINSKTSIDIALDVSGAHELISLISSKALSDSNLSNVRGLNLIISSKGLANSNLSNVYRLNSDIDSKTLSYSNLNNIYELNSSINSKLLMSSSLGSIFDLNSNAYSKTLAYINLDISGAHELISSIIAKTNFIGNAILNCDLTSIDNISITSSYSLLNKILLLSSDIISKAESDSRLIKIAELISAITSSVESNALFYSNLNLSSDTIVETESCIRLSALFDFLLKTQSKTLAKTVLSLAEALSLGVIINSTISSLTNLRTFEQLTTSHSISSNTIEKTTEEK